MLRLGASFVEVGVVISEKGDEESQAFRWKNVLSVLVAILRLLWDVYFARTENS